MNAAGERLLVVVADAEHARMLVRGDMPDSFRTQRRFDSGSNANADETAKGDFIAEVARQVNDAAVAGVFERLVLVAPPHAMHGLRGALSAISVERLSGMLHKDLVKISDKDIGAHLTWDALRASLA